MRRSFLFLLLSVMLLLKILFLIVISGKYSASPKEMSPKEMSWKSGTREWVYSLNKLTDNKLSLLTDLQAFHYIAFNRTLENILIPRIVGTEGNKNVREYIAHSMRNLGWTIQEDSFNSQTPLGLRPFTNVIATLNPEACQRLVIACHHDSLLLKNNVFLGATDSAVPCSMMINLAQVLENYLKAHKEKSDQLTLQYIFFDGEEALEKWNAADSLYGSRHLADKWSIEKVPQMNHCTNHFEYQINRIDVMILLDLLGSNNPKFYNYFQQTISLYAQFVDIENRLNELSYFQLNSRQKYTSYFNSKNMELGVEDDHVPFMKKGVPIVHLIPQPFPDVWHKEFDNDVHLHHPTISNLLKVLTVFITEYLNLSIP